VTISVVQPVEIKNPVPVNQARFPQFCVIERFCVEGSKNAVITVQSNKDLEMFY